VSSQVHGNRRVYSIVNPFVRDLVNSLHRTVEEVRVARRRS
jgi:hypothetical protein